MSDPPRLLAETRDPFARALLSSVEFDDGPVAGARGRALAALGSGAVTALAAGTAASTAHAVGAGGAAVAKGAAAGSFWLAKLLGIAVLGGAALVTAVHFGGSWPSFVGSTPRGSALPSSPSSPVASVAAVSAPPEEERRDVADPEPAPPQATASAPAPVAGPRVPGQPSSSARTPRSAALQKQIEQIDRARASLARGDSPGALAELDDINHHGNVLLAEEATVLRIDALLASGERRKAEALAQRFLAQHPGSAYAQRVRSQLVRAKAP